MEYLWLGLFMLLGMVIALLLIARMTRKAFRMLEISVYILADDETEYLLVHTKDASRVIQLLNMNDGIEAKLVMHDAEGNEVND